MNYSNIVILTTWDKETIEIQTSIENYLQLKSEAKSKGEDGLYLESAKRFIKFSNLKDEQGKKLFLSLPAPDIKPKNIEDYTPEERKERKILLDRIWEETKEGRKKKFIEQRKEILKRLEVSEKRHGMETTNNKLEKLTQFIKKELLKKAKQ